MKPPPKPKPKPGGLCGLTGCEKPIPPTALAAGDPFCSTACCRAFYGQQLGTPSGRKARAA